jgi:hypothetical protein
MDLKGNVSQIYSRETLHSNTVAEPHHFYAAPVPDPVPGENLDVT